MWARSSLGQPKGMRPVCGYQSSRAWKDIYYLWTWEHVEFSYTRTNGNKLGFILLLHAQPMLTKKRFHCIVGYYFGVWCGLMQLCWSENQKHDKDAALVWCVPTCPSDMMKYHPVSKCSLINDFGGLSDDKTLQTVLFYYDTGLWNFGKLSQGIYFIICPNFER